MTELCASWELPFNNQNWVSSSGQYPLKHPTSFPSDSLQSTSEKLCYRKARNCYSDHYHDPIYQSSKYHTCDLESNDSKTKRRGPRGGVVKPFPERLYEMLSRAEEEGFSHVISWQPHGRSFVIHRPKKFAADVMPRYFKQSKFTSFQRQLNLYNFSRISSGIDRRGYYHEMFLRGRPDLCKLMLRQRVKGKCYKDVTPTEFEPDFYAMEVCSEGSISVKKKYGEAPFTDRVGSDYSKIFEFTRNDKDNLIAINTIFDSYDRKAGSGDVNSREYGSKAIPNPRKIPASQHFEHTPTITGRPYLTFSSSDVTKPVKVNFARENQSRTCNTCSGQSYSVIPSLIPSVSQSNSFFHSPKWLTPSSYKIDSLEKKVSYDDKVDNFEELPLNDIDFLTILEEFKNF